MGKIYGELLLAMLRTGILGYGGGPSVVPLLRYEAVTRYRWLDDDEFGEVLAVANALPGPIMTKLAAYLGYRLKGVPGATLAVLAHILPTCVAMVALLSTIRFLSSSKVVAGMIAAVTPVVCVMLGMMAYEFAEKAVKGLGKVAGGICFLLSFLLLQCVHLHPALVIVVFVAYGAFHYKLVQRFVKTRAKKEGSTWSG